MICRMNTADNALRDFSRPLDVLRAAHARIQRQCDALVDLVAGLRKQGWSSKEREHMVGVIRELDAVSYRHEEDEEQDLLPRMMAAASRGHGASLTRMVTDIATEHRQMKRAWINLRAELQALAAGDRVTLDPLAVDKFIKLYRTHILMEEKTVYPLAEMLLSDEDLAAMGSHMAHRRSANPE